MIAGRVMLRVLATIISLASFAAMVAWYGFLQPSWLSYPRGSTFEPTRAEFRPGEVVTLKVFRCNSSDEQEIYLIAARLIRLDQPAPPAAPTAPAVLPGAPVLIQPGCMEEASKATRLADDTDPGTYFIQGLSKVDGLWRTSRVEWSSAPFVVPPAANAASAP
jgi:hypothetical protein